MDHESANSLYTDVTRGPDGVDIMVCDVTWEETHTPSYKWIRVTQLPGSATEEAIGKALQDLAKNPKYFGTCATCNTHKPVGFMWADDVCQGCASNEHGIVF
jgi:hypothetical protein